MVVVHVTQQVVYWLRAPWGCLLYFIPQKGSREANSIGWFKGKNTGNSHDLHGKIGLVSGEDFPLNQSFDQPFRKKTVVRWFPQEVPATDRRSAMWRYRGVSVPRGAGGLDRLRFPELPQLRSNCAAHMMHVWLGKCLGLKWGMYRKYRITMGFKAVYNICGFLEEDIL